MECEVCGEETSTFSPILIDGSEMNACINCAIHGVKKEAIPAPSYQKPFRAIKEDFNVQDNYGQTIGKARQKAGLTLKELALKVFETESLIKKVESNKMAPDEKLTKKLEKALNIKLSE